MTKFDIKIVSDTVCPWCYIGKKRLDRGIAAFQAAHPDSHDSFSITWLPYYLNANSPKTGRDKREYYVSRFGEQRANAMFDRLAAIGKDEGIPFRFGGKVGNTRDSHRLIQLGKSKGAATQTRVVEELFHAYFEAEQDITSHQALLAAAVKAGLARAEVEACLRSDQYGGQVDAEVHQAQVQHISGVPNFTIQGQYGVSGAQDPDTFVQLFEKIQAAEAQ